MVNGGSGRAPAVPVRGGSTHSNRGDIFPQGPGSSGGGPGAPATPEEQRRIRKYEAELAKRAADESKRAKENEFLRHSIRNSQKMRALKERQKQQQQQELSGAWNSGFSPDSSIVTQDTVDGGAVLTPGPAVLSGHTAGDLMSLMDRISSDPDLESTVRGDPGLVEDLSRVKALLGDARFQKTLLFAQKVEKSLNGAGQMNSFGQVEHSVPSPEEVTEDCISYLATMEGQEGGSFGGGPAEDTEEARELRKTVSRNWIEGLMYAHDKVNKAHSVGGVGVRGVQALSPADDSILERLSHYGEANVKIVRIEKSTTEPLGATVKNEGDAVLVGRIIRGGTAEASGLLHEGDEVLEVNGVELRGKDVNEVCDILAAMTGTLTFLVVPTRTNLTSPAEKKFPVVHVKAHIDYDPEDDPYVPCRELGISFQKGDILHVVNQRDGYWWQARRDGEEDTALPGLIPSAHFLTQREAMKNSIAGIDRHGSGDRHGKRGWSNTGSGFLCAKRSGRHRKNKHGGGAKSSSDLRSHTLGGGRVSNNGVNGYADMLDEADGNPEDVVTYEEVALYYPRAEHKRPVVLIGPPNIGRHELRQRLMLDQERFAAAIPHTSRLKRAQEVDGADYHFISRLQFEQDILSRKFVEHGEYQKAYYGTSLEAITDVVRSEKICVLNLHPQSLKMLKQSRLMPYVVFVAPPSLEKLKRTRMENPTNGDPVDDDELKDIIERARAMEDLYGHYFDMFITYADPERAYQQLLQAINSLEREPQWVPAAWLRSMHHGVMD